MKYAFIEKNVCNIAVAKQCRWLGVSSSGYYEWKKRRQQTSPRQERREVSDQAVALAFKQRHERYGSPRLTIDLRESGFLIAENTVAASLRRQGLVARAGKKFKATTHSSHSLPVAPNLLEQHFEAQNVNEKLCGDITYLWSSEGWLYLAVVIDLFSRRVIGWSMSHRITTQLVCDAMNMAIGCRGNKALEGAIMHTDRGSQYCSRRFQKLLKSTGMRASMSKRGDCYDNACAESFFHSLKVETIHGEEITTRENMRRVVFEYIERDYNIKRHHSALSYTAPIAYELANAA